MKKILFATTALTMVLIPSAAFAMPPVIAAVASVAGTLLMGGTLTAIGSLTGFGLAFAHVAIQSALGYAMQSLNKTGKVGTAGRGYDVNSVGPSLPHQIIYGEAKTGGAVFYQATSGVDNLYLHRCVAFAGHEIEGFQAFYFNDDLLILDASGNVTSPTQYVGFARITFHTGTDTQAADADLVSEVTEWTTAHQAKGIAYAHVRYTYDPLNEAFPDGVPTLKARIKGRKIYDPRTETTAWSDNPALIIRDYILADFGLEDVETSVNDPLITQAANICDDTVGSAKRYTCNGAFLLDAEPESVIQAITASMGGLFWYAQGKWACKAAKYTTPTIHFDEDDLRSSLSISTRNSRRENFNTVRGVYRGAETNWQETDYTEVTDLVAVADDGGEVASEIPLLFTSTDVMAQRIANIALKRNRLQQSMSATFGLKGLQVGIGDTIRFSNDRAGFTEKIFEVNDWRFAMGDDMDLGVQLLLREMNSEVFE